MKRYLPFLTFLALALYGCDGSSPTAPDFPEGNSREAAVHSSETTPPAPVSDPAPSTGVRIKIGNDGTVVNSERETYTACLFDGPYGAGKLIRDYKVKPGTTSLPYENETCEPQTLQLDVISGGTCPTTPHGLSPVAALVFTVDGSAIDCEECEEEEPVIIGKRAEESEWSECLPAEGPSASTVYEPQCFRTRTITRYVTYRLCDIVWEEVLDSRPEREACECSTEECVLPEEGTTLSWTGTGNPAVECAAFGPYLFTDDDEGDFYICKAGNDREVTYTYPLGDTCKNGKNISHVTACVCPIPLGD